MKSHIDIITQSRKHQILPSWCGIESTQTTNLLVAPTEKTDYQICKAGVKAEIDDNSRKHLLQARVPIG